MIIFFIVDRIVNRVLSLRHFKAKRKVRGHNLNIEMKHLWKYNEKLRKGMKYR